MKVKADGGLDIMSVDEYTDTVPSLSFALKIHLWSQLV